MFGKTNKKRKRPDASIRMIQNNPMKDRKNIQKMINTVNNKIQEGWIHQGRFYKRMHGTNNGKKFNNEHKKKISNSNKI